MQAWDKIQQMIKRFRLKPTLPAVSVQAGAKTVSLLFVRHPRARRYRLRLRPDGTAQVTIPRRGSVLAARSFVDQHLAWLDRQVRRRESQPGPVEWRIGAEIYFRGERVRIETAEGKLRFGSQTLPMPVPAAGLRAAIEKHLWKLARTELCARVQELAALHRVEVRRVTVRNQRSRWGSCSRSRSISLNWRLVQTPEPVRDYIILHELAHRRQMNHSQQFWQEVERLCPGYQSAEQWLKRNRADLF
ncbi:MAG: SprT family zinc-dependent metalloprotease [Verrucomicrobiota bacterium]